MDNTRGMGAFAECLAQNQHFAGASGYDYFKYNGKVKTNPDLYKKRPDRTRWAIIQKKANNDIRFFLVSQYWNMTKYKNIWWRDLIKPEAIKNYKSFQDRMKNMLNTVSRELREFGPITEADVSPTDKTVHTRLAKEFIANGNGILSYETLVALDAVTNVLSFWKEAYDNDPLLEMVRKRICKMQPFVLVYQNQNFSVIETEIRKHIKSS